LELEHSQILKGQQRTWEELLLFEKRKREEAEKKLDSLSGKMDLLLGNEDIRSDAGVLQHFDRRRVSQLDSLSGLVRAWGK
jgi:hypothetical protein